MYESLLNNLRQSSLYEVLQVSPRAEPDVIHAAYRVLARSYHPDVTGDPNAARHMRQLNAAYDVLSDPERRAQYDADRARSARTLTGERTARTPRSSGASGRVGALPAERGLLSPVARAMFAVLLVVLAIIMAFAVWFLYDALEEQVPFMLHPRASTSELTVHVPWWFSEVQGLEASRVLMG